MFARSLLRRFSVLKKLIDRKDWTGAISYLESNPKTEPVSPELLSDLMGHLYTEKKSSESYKLLLMMPSLGKVPEEHEYTLAIESTIESNKLSQALNLFYQAQVFGVPLDAIVYDKLLLSTGKEITSSNLKQILSCMIRDNSITSPHTLIGVLKNATISKDYQLVEKVLEVMKLAKYDIPKKIVAPFVNKNSSESSEFKSLKNYWKSIQKYISDSEKEVDEEKGVKKNKEPYSFGLFLMPNEKNENLNYLSESSEDDSSD
jgi:hypothetical protein